MQPPDNKIPSLKLFLTPDEGEGIIPGLAPRGPSMKYLVPETTATKNSHADTDWAATISASIASQTDTPQVKADTERNIRTILPLYRALPDAIRVYAELWKNENRTASDDTPRLTPTQAGALKDLVVYDSEIAGPVFNADAIKKAGWEIVDEMRSEVKDLAKKYNAVNHNEEEPKSPEAAAILDEAVARLRAIDKKYVLSDPSVPPEQVDNSVRLYATQFLFPVAQALNQDSSLFEAMRRKTLGTELSYAHEKAISKDTNAVLVSKWNQLLYDVGFELLGAPATHVYQYTGTGFGEFMEAYHSPVKNDDTRKLYARAASHFAEARKVLDGILAETDDPCNYTGERRGFTVTAESIGKMEKLAQHFEDVRRQSKRDFDTLIDGKCQHYYQRLKDKREKDWSNHLVQEDLPACIGRDTGFPGMIKDFREAIAKVKKNPIGNTGAFHADISDMVDVISSLSTINEWTECLEHGFERSGYVRAVAGSGKDGGNASQAATGAGQEIIANPSDNLRRLAGTFQQYREAMKKYSDDIEATTDSMITGLGVDIDDFDKAFITLKRLRTPLDQLEKYAKSHATQRGMSSGVGGRI